MNQWTNTAGTISHSIHVKLGDGAGNFAAPLIYPVHAIDGIAVADFDLDFNLDLALEGKSGVASFYIMRGTGDGQFQPPVAGTSATDGSSDIVTRDFNRDGRADVLLNLYNADHLNAFLNTAVPQSAIRGKIWRDYNQNGNLDAGDPPVDGHTVWADQNDDNVVDAGESSTTTRDDGTYQLRVPAGTHKVRQLLPQGWIETPRGQPGQKGSAYTIQIAAR